MLLVVTSPFEFCTGTHPAPVFLLLQKRHDLESLVHAKMADDMDFVKHYIEDFL